MLNTDGTALICPKCNAGNSLDAKKCSSCGYLFKYTTGSSAPTEKESEYNGATP
jgi:hypothetical protein